MKRARLRLLIFLLFCAPAGASARQSGARREATARGQGQGAGGSGAVDTSTWRIYRNDKYGFEVKYPDSWRVNAGSGSGAEIIAISQPLGGGQPRGSLTLAIQPNENPRKLSIKEWFAAQLQALKATPESQGAVTIGGQPAMFMENTNSFGTHHDTFTLLHETDVLSFGYVRQPELDATYAAIVSSFHVVK